MSQSLPVLMYHYISNFPGPINVSPKSFEEHCQGMAEAGWRGISLEEAESFFLKGEKLPPKSVLITFDDGYLDNYVYAWPILQKYGHHGVIFAVTERLSSTKEVRPTTLDVWNKKISQTELSLIVDEPIKQTPLGLKKRHDTFLSWEECRIMEKSRVMRIAAHSAFHLSVFASNTWEHIYTPIDQPRTFYKVDAPVVWGMPCFKERPALQNTAFIPSTELIEFITQKIPQDKKHAHNYFQSSRNTKNFYQELQKFPINDLGKFETETARQQRLYKEFKICKNKLEKELGHNVQSFCWPWGGSSPLAQKVGQDFGFTLFYTTHMGANLSKNRLAINRFKVRDKNWNWLKVRLNIYSKPLLAQLYAKIRI